MAEGGDGWMGWGLVKTGLECGLDGDGWMGVR